MFARVLTLACSFLALCLLSVPCLAETVTLDFLNHDPLPEWMTIKRGVYGDGLGDEGISNIYEEADGIEIWFQLDRPLTVDSVTIHGTGNFVSAYVGGECDSNSRDFKFPSGGTAENAFNCFTYNGHSSFEAWG